MNELKLPDAKKLIEEALDKSLQFFENNQFREAEVILKQLLRVDPQNVLGLQLLGLLNHKTKEYSEAIKLFLTALKIDPDNSENCNNIALSYACMGFVDKAIEYSEKSISLNPKNNHYYSNLGLHYRQKGNIDKAIECFKKSIEIDPNYFYAWSNLGAINGVLKNMDEAERCFRKAIELNPDYQPSYVDLAHVFFLRGNYQDAWPLYEHRLEYFPPVLLLNKFYDKSKKWDGQQSLKDKKIVVYCEQGIGDFIQFVRFVPKLKTLGARVCLHTPKELISLMRQNLDVEIEEIFHEYDYHCSMISLPHLLYIDFTDPSPYLKCEKKANVENYPEFKIGIAWAGNPQHPSDRVRSCKLEYFRKIHDLPNVKLFNLQKDIRPRKYTGDSKVINLMDNCDEMRIVDATEWIENFEDTAAFISAMDLIISVDTSILHLSGALGKKTWAILPFNPDWRWKLYDETTFWYPTMRLFRQDTLNDWDSVFTKGFDACKQYTESAMAVIKN